MEQIIEINGSLHEGGGQMIRSSLALSIILNKQFRIHSIRKNRPNPGINNQLRSIFSAFTQKVPKLGDSEVYFYPKFLHPNHIRAATAASCTLMLQCLMPIFAALGDQQEVKLEGGTDVSRSPPLQSIMEGLIPLLEKMNIKLTIGEVKRGYFPVGKGHITFSVKTLDEIKPISLLKLNPPEKVIITYYIKEKKIPQSGKKLQREIAKLLNQTFGEGNKIEYEVKWQKVFNTKDDYGIGCMILGNGMVWDIGTVGEGINQDTIIERLHLYLGKKCCLDEHHQDQLLLAMALASGKSQIFIGDEMSLHTESLIYVIKSFIPQIKITHEEGILSVQGIGLKIKHQ